MADPDRSDTYLEIQLDRETLVLAAVGFVVLLVIAFLVGRWTASEEAPETAVPATATPATATPPAPAQQEEVDGEPQFGASRGGQSAARAPVGPIPERPVPGAQTPGPSPKPGAGTAKESPRATTSPTRATTNSRPARPQEPAASEPEAKPVTTEAATSAGAKGDFFVQVLAAKENVDAERLKTKLVAKGHAVRILEEGGFFKVQVGPFPTLSEAEGAERQLKREDKLATWIRRT